MHISKRFIVVAFMLGWIYSGTAAAVKPVYSGGKSRAAVRGYDVVAYFEEDKAVQGSKEIALKHNGAVWLFSSEANKQLFSANPKKYLPQYGGYCAYSLSRNSIASSKPEYFTIHNGKLYLNYSKVTWKKWRKNKDEYITKANLNWPAILDR